MKIIKILLILISNIIYSQNDNLTNIEVEYNFIDLLRKKESKSILICNNQSSIFATYFNKKQSTKAYENNNGDVIIGSSIENRYHLFKNNKIISYKSFNGKDIYKIIDSIPKLNWNVNFKETKKIKKYSCNKAEVYFRGRNYTAWYSTEIPISFGPWKFNGLPGMILEISDKTNTFSWIAKKITYPSKKIITVPYKKTITTDLKNYQKKVTEYIQNLRARIKSKIPRKYGYGKPNKTNSRAGLELIFEWEEKK